MDRKNNDLVSELAGLGTVEFVRVMQLREFEEHLRAGKPVVMRETKQTLGLSDGRTDHLYIYAVGGSSTTAGERRAASSFVCPSCLTARCQSQRTSTGVCSDCAE